MPKGTQRLCLPNAFSKFFAAVDGVFQVPEILRSRGTGLDAPAHEYRQLKEQFLLSEYVQLLTWEMVVDEMRYCLVSLYLDSRASSEGVSLARGWMFVEKTVTASAG